MARIIDETKIEKIKAAATKLVVECGYGGASVAKIAKLAGVAEGYLYRHYASKYDLVVDILKINMNDIAEKLEQSQQKNKNISLIFEDMIRLLFHLAKEDSDKIKFLYTLMNDYNFIIDIELKQRILALCLNIKQIGLEQNKIASTITEEDIYLFGVSYPIVFINHRLKNFFNTTELDELAIQKVIQNSLKAIVID